MPRRASKWVIHEVKDKKTNHVSWDLSRGGRYLYTGLSSKAECVARLRNYYKPGEPVFTEAPDGYRTNVTEQLKRSRLI